MLITATIVLSGLSADVRRQSFIESYDDLSSKIYVSDLHVEVLSLQKDIYTDFSNTSKRLDILNIINDESVSNTVKQNSIEIINNLPKLFISDFDVDNVYTSSYDTIILEYVKNESNFTIDIGNKSFGYFGEINGEYMKIEDELFITPSAKETVISALNKDFIDFHNKI